MNAAGVEVQALLSSIPATNTKVGDKLIYWKSRLLAGLEATKKFQSLHESFSVWLKDKGTLLALQLTTSGTPEGIKEQLRDAQVGGERKRRGKWGGEECVCVYTYLCYNCVHVHV